MTQNPGPPTPEPPPRARPGRAIPSGVPLRPVPREARIFVNRNLKMGSLGAIGFDLDHTLAHYRVQEVDELAFRITQKKLVEKRGYPEEVLRIPYNPLFVVRGLVIDRKRGNILKMDYHNYVTRAYHGSRLLDEADRKRIYRMRRLRLSSDAYISVDTLFHMPEAYLYLALVDHFESRGSTPDFEAIYADVRAMIDEAHADGSIKQEIRADPAHYIAPDPMLGRVLAMFRDSSRKVFLLTNSEAYYTDVLLSFLLESNGGPSWKSYFDLVVVDACKPGYFLNRDTPGRFLEGTGEPGSVYSGGNVAHLEEQLGFAGDRILYWGDHTYGDILRSKKSVGWRTAMIIPELEAELATTDRISTDLHLLNEALTSRDRLDREENLTLQASERLAAMAEHSADSPDEVRKDLLLRLKRTRDHLAAVRAERVRLHREIAQRDDECQRAHNPFWGMLFRDGNEITRFGHQVRDFACIYTSRVSNLLNYPPDSYFRAPVNRLPHEW
ncbi:MAG: HAD-IG family 5'-nucleotidase [Gemmatimonadota bacterium]|nr:HAD-IG family 5'-nucleotidase [Gemmatimonadota bacterium]